MKYRIAFWALAGALVVAVWSLYFGTAHPAQHEVSWILLDITCPIALFRRFPISIYLVLAVNAATYALLGTLVETARRHCKSARLVPN